MLPEQVMRRGVLVRFAVMCTVLLSILPGALVGTSIAESNVEELTGAVVAYDTIKPSLTCVNGCQTSIIVRLDKPNSGQSKYVRVDLKFKDRRNFPNELTLSKRQWRFKVVRTVDRDENMEEFIKGEDVFGKEFKHPIWKLLPGAEDESLPFGQVLRSYSMMKHGFKSISG